MDNKGVLLFRGRRSFPHPVQSLSSATDGTNSSSENTQSDGRVEPQRGTKSCVMPPSVNNEVAPRSCWGWRQARIAVLASKWEGAAWGIALSAGRLQR